MVPDPATAVAAPTPADGTAAERWATPLVVGATVLAAVLVLFELGHKSLWYDEAFSLGIVDRPVGDALWRIAHWEVNMSPFYLALAGWWRLGQGEGFLRLLPAACSILSIPAIFALGRRLFDARVGAVAALLLAVHPLGVQWGQQLRGYSLVLLLVILSTTMLLRALERPEATGPALAYAAVASLATYGHFFAALVIVAHVVWLLLHRPLPVRLMAVAGGAGAVLLAPLGWYFLTRHGDPLYWVSDKTTSAIVDTATALTGGSKWAVAAYSTAGVAGLWAIAKQVREPDETRRWEPLLPVAWLVLPLLIATVSTATVKPLLEGRFLIVVVPALVLIAAAGLCRLGGRWGGALLAVLLVVSAVGIDRWYTTPAHEDWRGAATVVAAAAPPDGVVVLEPWGGVFPLRYYEDQLHLPQLDVLRPRAEDPPAGGPLVEVRRISDAGYPAPLEPGYRTWRDRYFELRDERHVEKLVIRTYERR